MSVKPDESLPARTRNAVAAVLAALVLAAPALAAAPAAAALLRQSPDPTPGFNGTVRATAYAGSTVYIGGDFTHALVAGKRIARGGLAAVDTSTGRLLDWAPAANGAVTALAAYRNDVFVAGLFDHINGVKRDSLARVDGSAGALRPGWKHLILGKPYALAVGHGRLYLGGGITRVGSYPRAALAAFSLATGALDARWAPSADNGVTQLGVTAERVYVAGTFRRIDDIKGSGRVAAVDPVTGALDPGFRAAAAVERAFGMAVTPEAVYVAHGGLGGRVRAYDHTGRALWQLTTDGDAQAVVRQGDVVYFGGHFDQVCGSSRVGDHGTCLDGDHARGKLAAADSRDGTLLGWRPSGNGVAGVATMAAAADSIAVGGTFTTINDVAQKRFALFGLA
jgi:hypothetical protein